MPFAFPLPWCSQNQRAFQKQDNIFAGKKRIVGAKKATVRETRYYKSVGLGIKTPRSAIEGTYVDKKCPWTGSVNIRGKFMTGIIKTAKMKNTVIIRKVRAAATRQPQTPLADPQPSSGSTALVVGRMPLTFALASSPPSQDYLHYIKKYNRFEKRHKNTPIHVSPCFRVKPGDEILAGQCRPLSKTVRFNMLKMVRAVGGKKGFDGM